MDYIFYQLVLWDWIELIVRWVHVITGIAWVGSSFYFIALDLGLRQSSDLPTGVKGEEWQVHGGGFYNIRKFMVAPPNLPENLTWFKWESYSTWLSGFVLLIIVYYGGSELILVDTSVLDISPSVAISLSLVSLVVGWLVYDLLCKSLVGSYETALMLMLFGILVIFSWLYCNIFSGRAAFLHLGALTATIMSANVFFIIIPNQKIVVNELKQGKTPDKKYGIIAKQRSTHNNYLTLPVIFMMISNHYPISFTSYYNWIIASLIFVMGVTIRHYFNSKHARKVHPNWTWIVTSILFLAVIFLSVFRPEFPDDEIELTTNKRTNFYLQQSSFEQVKDIVVSRCSMCHAREPLWDGFAMAPGGLILETDKEIAMNAKAIYLYSGKSNYMPPNNISYMEPEERKLIVLWHNSFSN